MDTTKILRGKLYNEIWETSLVSVSKKYNVPYSALQKICREADIPIPPTGYRTKVEFGKPVTKAPLSVSQITEVSLPIKRTMNFEKIDVISNNLEERINSQTKNMDDQHPNLLTFLSVSEKQRILLAAQQIKMSAENAQLHKKIVAYKSVVKEWNKNDSKEEFAQRSPKNYSKQPPFLAGVISNETLNRVYRILDTLFRQVESLGGSINDDLTLQIRNERVSMDIVENQDVIEHVLTKKEAQELIKYEDDKKRFSWASKPNIRKYDYIFNGKLRICIRKNRYFKDTGKTNIESMLGEMLVELYDQSEVVRIEREDREEEIRRCEEEARLREEKRNLFIDEVDRIQALQNLAMDYETACKIRAYVIAVEEKHKGNGSSYEMAAWIEWANKKADWFDPNIARRDELLGVREHEKNEEQKSLKNTGRFWW